MGHSQFFEMGEEKIGNFFFSHLKKLGMTHIRTLVL